MNPSVARRAADAIVTAFPDGRCFRVAGRTAVYDVCLVDSTIHCSCQAASFGQTCAHKLAVQHYLKEKHA